MSEDLPEPSTQTKGLEDIEAAEAFYDRRYRAGYMDDWPIEKLERVAALVRELPLPARGRVLDFGCGAGMFTAVLQSALPGWEVHGTDISAEGIGRAAAAMPGCSFHGLSDTDHLAGTFDLVFTHHVLEHVSDIRQTADLLTGMLNAGGAMLHILPCGDSGGFEASVCAMRRDGVEPDRENRFFFDEEGHLRRLTTQGLIDLWANAGFVPERVYRAARWSGALERLTASQDFGSLWQFADPDMAVDATAANRLRRWRAVLVTLWLMRKPTAVVGNKLGNGVRSVRDLLMLVGGVTLYPLSKPVDWFIRRLASREWSRDRHLAGGSEMYVFLIRRAVD